jgi:hypothetical protein
MISIPLVMPVMIPVSVTVVMPVPIVIPISIPLVMPSTLMTLDTPHYTAGDSLARIFLRPARQRQRTGRQRDSASGGK